MLSESPPGAASPQLGFWYAITPSHGGGGSSPHDDSIRLAAYRAIYRHDSLERYAIESLPPIRIIVKNGHVTLEGVVNSQLDKTLAATQARSVPGVFSVTDNLRVEKWGGSREADPPCSF